MSDESCESNDCDVMSVVKTMTVMIKACCDKHTLPFNSSHPT